MGELAEGVETGVGAPEAGVPEEAGEMGEPLGRPPSCARFTIGALACEELKGAQRRRAALTLGGESGALFGLLKLLVVSLHLSAHQF